MPDLLEDLIARENREPVDRSSLGATFAPSFRRSDAGVYIMVEDILCLVFYSYYYY